MSAVQVGMSLGQILVEQGAITPEKLKDALKRQETRAKNRRLGDVLVSFGYISTQQLAKALAAHLGLELVNLQSYDIPQDVLQTMTPSIAKIYQAVPVKKEGSKLFVAMADPTDFRTIDNLRLLLECQIKPLITTSQDIAQAIKTHYGIEDVTIESMLSTVTGDSISTLSGLSSLSVSTLSVDSLSMDLDGLVGGVAEESDDQDDDGKIVRLATTLILEAFRERASDIHIEPFEKDVRIRFRIDGVCQERRPLPKEYQKSVLSRLKIMSGMDISERRIPQDGRIKIQLMGKDLDLRCSALPGIWGESFVMRILDKSGLSLDLSDLGFLHDHLINWQALLKRPTGLILVTGPTGSGKTTTLYASLNTINTPDKKLITVEDPVEYMLAGINQVHVHADIGLTFATALRAILRQSPDIVMVGEIRDQETAEIAIRAALTGNLVFSTLHTNDAASSLTRLMDMGVPPYLVASAVQAIMAQRLVRTVCPSCKKPYRPQLEILEQAGLDPEEVYASDIAKGDGCANCGETGYVGRIPIFELLIMDDAVRNLALQGAPDFEMKEAALAAGMKTLRHDGFEKVLAGRTSIEEVARITQADERKKGLETA